MTWLERIQSTAKHRATVMPWSEPGHSTVDRVRTYTTRCELLSAGTSRARLAWRPEEGGSSPPLTACLREFVSLSMAPDSEIEHQIHDFARRFGPLWRDVSDDTDVDQRRPFEEPLIAWRQLSEGYAALLGMVSDVRHDRPIRPADWSPAMATIGIPAWFADQEGALDPPGPDGLHSLLAWHLGAGNDLESLEVEREALRRLIGMVMVLSGVQADAYLDADSRVRPTYALPVMGVMPERGRNPLQVWRVPRLLPILAVQIAEVIDNDWIFRCTWCDMGAIANERRPRGDLPWYGNHEKCRDAARKATKGASRAKARAAQTEVKG